MSPELWSPLEFSGVFQVQGRFPLEDSSKLVASSGEKALQTFHYPLKCSAHGLGAHTCDPSAREARARSKFKAKLDHIAKFCLC